MTVEGRPRPRLKRGAGRRAGHERASRPTQDVYIAALHAPSSSRRPHGSSAADGPALRLLPHASTSAMTATACTWRRTATRTRTAPGLLILDSSQIQAASPTRSCRCEPPEWALVSTPQITCGADLDGHPISGRTSSAATRSRSAPPQSSTSPRDEAEGHLEPPARRHQAAAHEASRRTTTAPGVRTTGPLLHVRSASTPGSWRALILPVCACSTSAIRTTPRNREY